MLRSTTVSYKNHKTIEKDAEDWIVIPNTHEPLETQEVWDKIRELEKSGSQGKRTKKGETMPLSGLMFCADCGEKMRLGMNNTVIIPYGQSPQSRYIRYNNIIKAGLIHYNIVY